MKRKRKEPKETIGEFKDRKLAKVNQENKKGAESIEKQGSREIKQIINYY